VSQQVQNTYARYNKQLHNMNLLQSKTKAKMAHADFNTELITMTTS